MTASDDVVGLIPAAGYATRLQPLASSKEVLEVRGRPLMSFLLERMRLAGCSRIRVTTRPEKTDVVELARLEKLEVVLGRPGSVSESLLAARTYLPDDAIALVGFPDTVWEPAEAYGLLVQRVRAGEDIVLGLFEVDQPNHCDVVEVSSFGRISRISVKPDRPRTNLTWGILAARVALLHGLAGWDEPAATLTHSHEMAAFAAYCFAGPTPMREHRRA